METIDLTCSAGLCLRKGALFCQGQMLELLDRVRAENNEGA